MATPLTVWAALTMNAQKILRRRDIKLTADAGTDEGLLPLHAAMHALPSLGGTGVSRASVDARRSG